MQIRNMLSGSLNRLLDHLFNRHQRHACHSGGISKCHGGGGGGGTP